MQNHCKFILRENILNMEYRINDTRAILLIKQVKAIHVYSFTQTWISFTHGLFVQSLVDTGPVVLETIFKYRAVFFYFVIISPWKRVGPIIWTNLNPLQLRWSTSVFPLFSYYIPFEGDITLHLYKKQLFLCV